MARSVSSETTAPTITPGSEPDLLDRIPNAFNGYDKQAVAQIITSLRHDADTYRTTLDERSRQLADSQSARNDLTGRLETTNKELGAARESMAALKAELATLKKTADRPWAALGQAAQDLATDAQTRHDAIIADAKTQADTIIADAKTRADAMLAETGHKRDLLEKSAEQAARQAADDAAHVRSEADDYANRIRVQIQRVRGSLTDALAIIERGTRADDGTASAHQ